jgi:hypothetical protein
MTGENGQASLNVMGTRTLPRVTAETPENGKAMGKKLGNRRCQAKMGKRRLTSRGHVRCHVLQRKRLKTDKRRTKNVETGDVGQKMASVA